MSLSVTATNSFWRCPRCRGELAEAPDKLHCKACAIDYPVIAGIPDLRVPGASWIDQEEDRELARRLIDETRGATAREMVRHVYGWRTERTAEWAELRTNQVMDGVGRMRREIREWLDECTSRPRGFLEVGCGNGQLLAAAAAHGRIAYGIDVRLVWLVVAKRLVEEAGGVPRIAAAMAEALPLADHSMDGIVSLDVIEHVGDVQKYLGEIDRVSAPGAIAAFATPNRYSLTSEPHVYIWGVGWVPRKWQKAYVKFRKGISYEYTQLLSVREACKLVRRSTRFVPKVLIPKVPEEELRRYSTYRRVVAGLYNRLTHSSLLKPVFSSIDPFFRVLAYKPLHTQ